MLHFDTVNNIPPEGIESGGPLSTLGDFVLPVALGELGLPICVNVRPLPRSDGYNHAVQVAQNTVRNIVSEEVERTLQSFLNGLTGQQTYQNAPPRQDPNGLPGIQSHQLVRPFHDDSVGKLVPLSKPNKKSLKNELQHRLKSLLKGIRKVIP
jgi:hypothetical protein